MDNRHIFKDFAPLFLDRGYSVIPDKFQGKTPLISQWSDFCYRKPNAEEVDSWVRNFKESNIAIALGEASGVIAVDVDTEDEELLELIRTHLLPSPYEKVGNKGFTRFYRYTSESTQIFKHNKEVLFELLSNGKKTTLPPSIHPNGITYKWSGPSLLDVNPKELPVLPPFNLSRIFDLIRSKYPDNQVDSYGQFSTNGRNDALVKLCCKLIGDQTEVGEAVNALIKFDQENHEIPYFTDPEENLHIHAFTNALKMYSYQLNRINGIHHKKNEIYETPLINKIGEVEVMGKQVGVESLKKVKKESLFAPHVLGILQKTILDNSWIKQPDLALSASLALLAVLVSRKFTFSGLSPNLYLLNIAPSGSGKDAPQQLIKKFLTDIGQQQLLGAGDYVSDASLMDSLGVKPTRLDIMDEAGGILKTFTTGGSDYNKKMADILCELYTTSNAYFLGRATAEGTKGSCYRPNVNILASTTPTGFSEGVSRSAIEKGLLGRFLIFFGDSESPAVRLRDFPGLPKETSTFLRDLATFEPAPNHDLLIGGIEQRVQELRASEEAHTLLDIIFSKFDKMRRDSDKDDPMLPITSRLYQQMIKITIICAISRAGTSAIIEPEDIKFSEKLIMYYYEKMKEVVDSLVHGSQNEKAYKDILKYLPKIGEEGITKQKLSVKTRSLGKRRRDELLSELEETGEIFKDLITDSKSGKQYLLYWRVT